jgi:hypothetical protein
MRLLALVVALLPGCAHRVSPGEAASQTGRTVVVMADSMLGGSFPQVADSARLLADGSVRAASDAPLCAKDLIAKNASWDEVQTPVQSRYLKAVALRLPPGFEPAWFSRPRAPGEDDPESTEYWGHLLGSWQYLYEGSAVPRAASFTVWIGPEEGYPSSFVGGGEVTQGAFSECRVDTSLGLLAVAQFVVVTPQPTVGGHYVVTYAELKPGVYIRAMGIAPEASLQGLLLSSISSIRVLR